LGDFFANLSGHPVGHDGSVTKHLAKKFAKITPNNLKFLRRKVIKTGAYIGEYFSKNKMHPEYRNFAQMAKFCPIWSHWMFAG
jgi:hypothetical protein